ncbi:MAG TPA: hypothetical protein VEX66_11450 [Microlunatus sp.]|nr:hypothetical protein [Microlunatus sp.]
MTRFANDRESCQLAASVASWSRRGVTRATLGGPQFSRTTYGFYRRAGSEETSAQRILDAVAGLPEGAWIAGWAAAYVRGVDALDGLDDHTMAPLRVPVLLPPGQRRRSTNGIEYRQSTRRVRGQRIEGIPVTTIARTTLDLALLASDVSEAVVGLDAVLGARLLTYPQLQRLAGKLPSRRGVQQARRALELARVGVASTWESRLRVFAAVELGWLNLEPNRAVFDGRGQLLGVPDLLDVEAGLVLEYDGARWRAERSAGHRDRAQHREDNAREELLERAGLVVVRVEKDDLTRFRPRLAERLRAAREDGMRRDRTRDRWTLDEPEWWVGLPA